MTIWRPRSLSRPGIWRRSSLEDGPMSLDKKIYPETMCQWLGISRSIKGPPAHARVLILFRRPNIITAAHFLRSLSTDSPMANQANFNDKASRKGKSNEFSPVPRLPQNCSSRTLDHPVDDTALMRYRWDRWNNRGSYWVLRAGPFFRNMLANSLAPWRCASLVSVSIVKLSSPRILRLLHFQLECVSDPFLCNLKSILWPPGLDVTKFGMGGRSVGKYLI